MRSGRRRARLLWPARLVVVGLLAAGAVVTIQPVAETLTNDRAATRAAAEYTERIAQQSPADLRREWAAAQMYNAELPAGLVADPWGETPGSVAGPAHDAYLRQLASAPAMARVRIPAIDVDLPVFHDADDASLRAGAGHMYGTALPVGGDGTHAVLAAHTGWRGATFFDRLPELGDSSTFTVDVAGQRLSYRVDQVRIVEAWELEAVRPVKGRDLVTLVTCITPPGQHKQRLLVRGTRVPNAAVAQNAPAAAGLLPIPMPAVQSWMWPRITVAGAALLFLLVVVSAWVVAGLRRKPAGRHRYAMGEQT